jgi:hypothetical protein
MTGDRWGDSRRDHEALDSWLTRGPEDVWLDEDDPDVQNPRKATADGVVYAAHCSECATYTHDQASDPGVDYVCDECIARAEGDDAAG